MKSYGNLWDVIVDPLNLSAAWEHFKHIHAGEKKIRWWGLRAPTRLAALHRELVSGTYRPGPYHRFYIYEPKPRCICRAPIRDRIVHHALCKVIAPIIERGFIERTYSCRVGKGSHLACMDARRMCTRGGYFLKIDVRHYFDTIDLSILKSILLPMFREKKVRDLVSLVIDSRKGLMHPESIGLPLGNLTSQWFANFYLSACDHYATETLGLGNRYIRYMDDILVFADTSAECHSIHRLIKEWLSVNRKLELKEEATVVAPVLEGVPFLGLRIWADRWRLKRSRYRRARRTSEAKYMAFMRGEIDARHLQQCGRSHTGSIEWFGFKGILTHVGERTLAREGLAAADDGLPLGEKVTEEQGKPSPLDEHPSGGAWNYSPASGITSLGARAGNAPSNANTNGNNGFRLANSMISRTTPSSCKTVSEAQQETFLLDVEPAAFVPEGARSGGGWNWSPAAGVTSLGARACNAPSNVNNNNGFRLANSMISRTPQSSVKAVPEAQREMFLLDVEPAAAMPKGIRSGGSWQNSPATGVTSLGARCLNAPSNANNNNNGFRLANSMISRAIAPSAKAVSEALQETFLLDAEPVASVPAGARSGGSWNNSPAPRGVTSLGARAANAPSNADNNNNGFRLASTRTPGVTLPLGATPSPLDDGENIMGQFRKTCAPDIRRRTCTDRTGTSRRASAQSPVRVQFCTCGGDVRFVSSCEDVAARRRYGRARGGCVYIGF